MDISLSGFLFFVGIFLVPALGVLGFGIFKEVRRGMVWRWREQPHVMLDRDKGSLRVSFSKTEMLFPFEDIKSLDWSLIDWLESTDQDNSSMLTRQSLRVTTSTGETEVFRFDIENPSDLVRDMEGLGLKVHRNYVNE